MTGAPIGPYRVLARLGAGGMGEVYLGHDPRLDRRVALKCLTSVAAATPEGRARILREGRAAARLTHAHIAGIYDVLEVEDRTYIVMEYVEGVSLSAYMEGGARPFEEVCAVGRQIASALAAAHAHGVIHRDLKPANIQVMNDGGVKVLDFGVARLALPTGDTDGSTADPTLDATVTGSPGTPIYMAPEQLAVRPADARSDIYSLGLVLFLMATGRRPFLETAAVPLALAMNAGPAPSARSINPSVPQLLSDVIAHALERDPERRFQSAHEFEEALAAVAGGATTIVVDRAPRPVRPRLWTWVAAAVVVLAALAALRGVAGRFGIRRAPSPPRPTVVAILPVDNPTGEPHAEYIGAGIASLVADNLGALPGISVLPRSTTAAYDKRRADLSPLQRETNADYVIDLLLKQTAPLPELVARLRRPDRSAPLVERTLTGDPLSIDRALLDLLGRALDREGAFSRRPTDVEWARLRRLPTTSGEALTAFSEARALVDRADRPGNLDRGIALLERAVATDPAFATAHAALGDALWLKYRADRRPEIAERATAEVLEALRIDPDRAEVHQSLAVMYEQTGQPKRAIEEYKRSLDLQPDNDETHRRLALALAGGSDFDAAVAAVRRAIAIRPSYWNHWFTLGFIYYSAGRYEDALEAYRRTSELQPNDARVFAMLGTMHHLLDQVDQAIGNYEHAVRLGPSRTAFANLGLAYYTSQRYPEALDAYQQAAKLDPNFALTYRNIGDVYVRLRNPSAAADAYVRAIALANESLKVNPRDPSAISLIATCEAKLDRRDAAARHAAEAVALAPTNREALVRSAQVHARLGRRDAALRDLAAAIAHGYDRRQARQEDEFESLRDWPPFQNLVAGTPPAAGR